MAVEDLRREILTAASVPGMFSTILGQSSHYYLDAALFVTNPELLTRVVTELRTLVPDATDVLAATFREDSVILTTALALKTNLPMAMTRHAMKGHGTNRLIEGAVVAGAQVCLVETIMGPTGPTITAAKTLRESGATVDTVIAVLSRRKTQATTNATLQRHQLQLGSLYQIEAGRKT